MTGKIGDGGSNIPHLKCRQCNEVLSIKRNKGIYEEYERISANIHTQTPIPSCPTEECPNHKVGIDQSKEYYQKFGKTKSGSQRYKCKRCGKVFTPEGVKSTVRQRIPYITKRVFKMLMNKSPFKRI